MRVRRGNPTQGARTNSCVKSTGGQTDHPESRSFKLLCSFKLLGCPTPRQQKLDLPRTRRAMLSPSTFLQTPILPYHQMLIIAAYHTPPSKLTSPSVAQLYHHHHLLTRLLHSLDVLLPSLRPMWTRILRHVNKGNSWS